MTETQAFSVQKLIKPEKFLGFAARYGWWLIEKGYVTTEEDAENLTPERSIELVIEFLKWLSSNDSEYFRSIRNPERKN